MGYPPDVKAVGVKGKGDDAILQVVEASAEDLAEAEPRLNFQSDSWILPASETKYRESIRYVEAYLRRLADTNDPNAQFYARADNLTDWLAIVEKRLGSLSQRLSASVGRARLNTDLSGDTEARQSTDSPAVRVATWTSSSGSCSRSKPSTSPLSPK